MTDLERKISEASQKYYTDGTSNISDSEFDLLLSKLREENPDSELLGVGHGYDVAKDTTPGEKINHFYGRAGSLDKFRNWKEMSADLKDKYVCASLKLDGLSVVLYYRDNVLIRALTRGDGETGIDITDKVIKIWPRYIESDDKFTGAIRGELVMSFANFDRYKELHPEMKNPRNTAAGIINSKDGSGIEYLDIIVYTVVGYEGSDANMLNYEYMHNKLCEWFPYKVVYSSSCTKLYEKSLDDKMNKFRRSWYGYYPADGIVVTACGLHRNGNEITYDANAYKFPSEIKESKVVEVQWNMSKTRYAVPKVRIEPIELAGTTVEWCTGYNADYIRSNGIGPGSIVTVEKRGEIIPNIQEVLTRSSNPSFIYECPDCGNKLSWSGTNLVCDNPNCSNAREQDVLVWFNKLVPTDGLGDTLILNFLNDIELDEISVDSIMKFQHRLAEDSKSVQWNLFAKTFNELVFGTSKFKLVSAIEALNIPRLGTINALKLSHLSDYVKKMCKYKNNDIDVYFWDSLATRFGSANTISCSKNLEKFSRLSYIYDRIIWESSNSVEATKVAVTGKLSVKRSDFEKELNYKGYILGDISKDTKFLITDDPNSNSSKNKRADKFGVEKITESDFRKRFL